MERLTVEPRPDWRTKVSAVGFPIHSSTGPYWDESACYAFTADEVTRLEAATNELHRLTLEGVEQVIRGRRYAELQIPEVAARPIELSWEANGGAGDPSLYGRLDLAYDGSGPPKLLEYNADTPTALIEAAVVQWDWLTEAYPALDQFNSIHERILAGWRDLSPHLSLDVHFTCLDTPEDVLTASYLQDLAAQAGLRTHFIEVRDIGWDGREFVDVDGKPLRAVFKLYPWEWLVREPFAEHLPRSLVRWIEPPWKMIVSNKGFLAVLWELFPGHENLLAAYRHPRGPSYARKPLLAREGANVTLVRDGVVVAQGEDQGYGAEGYVYQDLAGPTERFGGKVPVLGSWLVQGEAAGLGVREADGPITSNTSRFVPHLINADAR